MRRARRTSLGFPLAADVQPDGDDRQRDEDARRHRHRQVAVYQNQVAPTATTTAT
jgi:hypothetical protein